MQMHFTLFSGVTGTFILSHLLGTPAFRQARSGNAARRLHLEVKSGKVVQGCVPSCTALRPTFSSSDAPQYDDGQAGRMLMHGPQRFKPLAIWQTEV